MGAGFRDLVAWLLGWKSSGFAERTPAGPEGQLDSPGLQAGEVAASGSAAGQVDVAGAKRGQIHG